MFKKCLTLVLILTLFQIPLGLAGPPPAEIANGDPTIHIDSSLSLESFPSVSNLGPSSGSETTVLLEFENELTSEQIFFAESNNLIFSKRDSSIIHVGSIYAATITDTTSVSDLSEIGLIQMTPSKQFIPSLTSSVESIGAPDVWSNLQRDGVSITGIGVTVAVIDTGASWIHPTFWRASTGEITVLQDGSDFYADINGNDVIDTNEGPIAVVDGQTGSEIIYGSTYMFIDTNDNGVFDYIHGDQWLGPVDANDDGKCTLTSENVVVLGESKIAKLYDQTTGMVYIRDVNMTDAANVGDMNGHGTHVASTVAGGQPGMTSYVGVAPGADLIIIKSPLDSVAILDAIQFAIENDVDIINMSFSSYLGFLDGTDTEDLAISEAFMEHGVMSTLAAGNLGGRSKHARFAVSTGSTAGATLSVSNPPSYSFLNLLWNSDDDNEQVFLTAPGSSEPIDLGVFSEIDDSAYILETETLSVYVFADTSVRGMNRLIIQVSEDDHFWDAGTWTVSVSNPSGAPVWIDAYAWDNSWSGTSLRFSSMVDSSRTISTPGTADLGITVASYNEVSGDTSASSSKGPRVDGARKPDVIAPGDGINAARNSLTTLWATRSGTSMAAPHVAGVLALIRQASHTDNGWTDLSSLYAGAGRDDAHYSPPSSEWGYGLVDPAWSSQHLLEPELDVIFWDGINPLITDAADASINSSLDINEIKVHQTLETLSISIRMNGIVDFTGNDILTVYWDVDSSLATGFQGADILLNITNDQSTLFEWSGSVFQTSSSSVEWLNESQTVLIGIQRTEPDSYGRISVMTSNETTSPLDDTALTDISDQWRPIVNSLSMTVDGTNYGIDVKIADTDSPNSVLEIGMSVIDGAQNILDSEMVTGVNSSLFQIDSSDFQTDDILNVVLNISDGSETIYLPFIALTTGLSTSIEFVNATIDQEVIHVGPLISERITGQIVLTGHLFVSDVRLSFISSLGLKLNLTLNGAEGIYDFDVSPSGFSLGDYEVYVIAFDQSGTPLELNFASLSIVADYTIVVVIGGIAAVCIIMIVIIRNRSQTLEVV